MTESAALSLEFAGLTDVGRSRSRNEDKFDVDLDLGLALVCDGMGGHAGGDLASRTAAESIIDFIYEYDPDAHPDQDGVDDDEETYVGGGARDGAEVGRSISTIRAAIRLANRRLISLNQERGFVSGRGMGTTVVGLWLVQGTNKLIIFHAGDSRLYRLRASELQQITRDHSLYQAWLDNGGHGTPPQKNIIVRALGTSNEVEPDVSLQPGQPGDVFLLCSDGLTSMVEDGDIAAVVRAGADGPLDQACARLIALANERGGHDNITVVLARLTRA